MSVILILIAAAFGLAGSILSGMAGASRSEDPGMFWLTTLVGLALIGAGIAIAFLVGRYW